MNRLSAISLIAALVSAPTISVAQSCEGYPYSSGINIEEQKGTARILSTSSVALEGEGAAALKVARDKAQAQAEAGLKDFLKSDVSSNAKVLQAIENTPSMGGDQYERRNTALESALSVSGSAKSLMGEIALFRICTVKGSELRATVVIKPEAMKRAAAAAGRPAAAAVQPEPPAEAESADDYSAAGSPSDPDEASDAND